MSPYFVQLRGRLRLIFDAPDLETARRLKDELGRDLAHEVPKAAARLKEGFGDAMAVMEMDEVGTTFRTRRRQPEMAWGYYHSVGRRRGQGALQEREGSSPREA